MKKLIIMLIAIMLMSAAPIQAETNNRTAKTEQVTNQATDKNPVVGQDKKGRTIHQGAKGGLYYWTTTKRGDNAGKIRKAYLTKAEKEEFYRDHPQVKRPN